MRVATYNVNGAASSAADIARLASVCDVICLQEIKSKTVIQLPGFCTFWTCADRSNHHGTAILAREALRPEPVNAQLPDPQDEQYRCGHFHEGRITGVRCHVDQHNSIVVLSVYSPNSGVSPGRLLARLDYRVRFWDPDLGQLLDRLRLAGDDKILLCGDLNVAVRDQDVHNSKTLRRKAGFTDEERGSFRRHILSRLTDTWAELVPWSSSLPDRAGFTFFGRHQKAVNKGWRLDYLLHSTRLRAENIRVLRDFESSDHVPVLADFYL
jgi:exodeoxyribonuclease-3